MKSREGSDHLLATSGGESKKVHRYQEASDSKNAPLIGKCSEPSPGDRESNGHRQERFSARHRIDAAILFPLTQRRAEPPAHEEP